MEQKINSNSKIQKEFLKIVQDIDLYLNETNELEKFYTNTFVKLQSLIEENELKLHLSASSKLINASGFIMLQKPNKSMESIIKSFNSTTYCKKIRNQAKIIGNFVFLDGFYPKNQNIIIRVVKYKDKKKNCEYSKYLPYILVHFFERKQNQQQNLKQNQSWAVNQSKEEKIKDSFNLSKIESVQNKIEEIFSEYLFQQTYNDESQNSNYNTRRYDQVDSQSQNQQIIGEKENLQEQKKDDPKFIINNSNCFEQKNIFENVNFNLKSEQFSFNDETSNKGNHDVERSYVELKEILKIQKEKSNLFKEYKKNQIKLQKCNENIKLINEKLIQNNKQIDYLINEINKKCQIEAHNNYDQQFK